MEQILGGRAVSWLLAAIVVISVLPIPGIDALWSLFAGIFALDIVIRIIIGRKRGGLKRTELWFLLIDTAALISFLPFERWLGVGHTLLVVLRLTRLLVLVRFVRGVAVDVYHVITRRAQLQQFALVTAAVLFLAFLSAVLLAQLDIEHDYEVADATFWDRMWWSFRQLEDPGNLVENLRVNPLIALLSLGLTITGVFIVSFVIGLGTNIVAQVVEAERRRPVDYEGHSLLVGPIAANESLVREFVRIYAKNGRYRRFPIREIWSWLMKRGRGPRRFSRPRMVLLGAQDEVPAYVYDTELRGVIYRAGDASHQEDLDLVAAEEVKRAIFLAHREAGYDTDAVTVAALGAFRRRNKIAHAFVEVVESGNRRIVSTVGGPGTFALDVSHFFGLFLCHHLVTPGAQALYRMLLSTEGSEFYTHVFVEPDEREVRARIGHRAVRFIDLAYDAYRRHHVLLAGVFGGEANPERTKNMLVPTEGLVPWINPIAEDSEQTMRMDEISGVIGIASTYGPMREAARDCLERADRVHIAPEPSPELAAWTRDLSFDARPVRRVLIVGFSPALASLIKGLCRFVPNVEVIAVLSARGDARTPLEQRLETLRLEQGIALRPGQRVSLDRGGHATVYTHEAPDLAHFAIRCLSEHGAVDAAVFLGDPESIDTDARTMLRALRFAEALRNGEVPKNHKLRVIAEIDSEAVSAALEARFSGSECGFARDQDVELTLLSTERLRNYFLVHSAFVPGVTDIYETLLDERGQEIVRLDASKNLSEGVNVGFFEIATALRARGVFAIALELTDGRMLLNPPVYDTFRLSEIRAVFAIGDSAKLSGQLQ